VLLQISCQSSLSFIFIRCYYRFTLRWSIGRLFRTQISHYDFVFSFHCRLHYFVIIMVQITAVKTYKLIELTYYFDSFLVWEQVFFIVIGGTFDCRNGNRRCFKLGPRLYRWNRSSSQTVFCLFSNNLTQKITVFI
jgi:hypothetical protein